MRYKIKNKRNKIYVAIAAAIVFCCILAGIIFYRHATVSYPLGNRLEYIGKIDYGCWLVCDANPASTYYYATDMSIDELEYYFTKTALEPTRSTTTGVTYFGLRTPQQETIYLYYYTDKTAVQQREYLRNSTKPYIVSLPSFKYQLAKASL